jgi:hypothetical protein
MNRKGGGALGNVVGSTGGSGSDLKLTGKHLIRRIDVLDRKDSDDVKHAFELLPRNQVCICQMAYFQTKNPNLGKFWKDLQWEMLVYFMAIWYILW